MTNCLALCIHQRLARAWDVFALNWHILYADEKSLNPSVKLLCLCIAEGGSGAWHLPEPSRSRPSAAVYEVTVEKTTCHRAHPYHSLHHYQHSGSCTDESLDQTHTHTRHKH